MTYDVLIIGAGVSGAFIARELSRYSLDVCMLEKCSDVAMGASKANSGIVHSGYDALPGTLKAKLNIEGKKMMKKTAEELDAPFIPKGSLVLAYDEDEIKVLNKLLERGIKNGITGLEIIGKDKILELEPETSDSVLAALYAEDSGIVCPYELTIAACENAVDNGVHLFRETWVKDIETYDGYLCVKTNNEDFKTRYIVNAAGVYADEIASMIGDVSFSIKARKGEYVIYDKKYGELVNNVIFQAPTRKGKGVLITSTVDGNLLIGPNSNVIEDKQDLAATIIGYEEIWRAAFRVLGEKLPREPIVSFSGSRATPSTHDFIISPSDADHRFINVAGIESPGLTAAPAIGRYVVEILKGQGCSLVNKKNFDPYRRKVIRTRELAIGEYNELIKRDPMYGNMICRCEKVSEGEVVDSIRRSVGARDVDAVKRRTRAGMGRCQSGFCGPYVLKILARELGLLPENITKKGGDSGILTGRTK